jgi:serine/threonine protein kinase
MPFPLPPCSTESDVKHAHREIMNHQRLLHPHVVQLKEVFAVKPYLAVVMEYVPNGDMFQVRLLACLLLSACSGHYYLLFAVHNSNRSTLPPWPIRTSPGHAPHPHRPCPALQYVVSRRGLPESEARWFFQQLMLGMDYCHRKGEGTGQ